MGQCLGGGHPSGPKGSPEGPGCGWELPGPCKWDIEDTGKLPRTICLLMSNSESKSLTDGISSPRMAPQVADVPA